MAHRTTPLIFGLLLALGVATVSPAQAHCNKDAAELLKFAVDNASSNFAAINGGLAGGDQYNLTPAAEQVCPNSFILSDNAATDKSSEYWVLKFDYSETGTEDDVVDRIITQFSAALQPKGFQDKPYGKTVDDGYWLEWDGPSNTWVTVETFQDDQQSGKTSFEVRVGHDVK